MTPDERKLLIPVTREEMATILAALLFYENEGMGNPDNRHSQFHDIATDGGELISLNGKGVDDLCEHINLNYIDGWPQRVSELLTYNNAQVERRRVAVRALRAIVEQAVPYNSGGEYLESISYDDGVFVGRDSAAEVAREALEADRLASRKS